MPHADFVHLRVHTAYSLAEGAIPVKDVVAAAKAQAMPAVAVTDTANLYGALEFAESAAKEGVQPILGVQFPLARPAADAGRGLTPAPDQLVLLAQDETGWRNLMHLVSRAHVDVDPTLPPQLALDRVAGRTDGLICLSGGPAGPISRLLAEGQATAATAFARTLESLFPGRFYLELQRHGLPLEDQVEGALLDLADALNLPLVATNDCYFLSPEMYDAHDALLCIAEGAYVTQQDRRRVTPDHHFRSASDMRTLFADLPEACDNTLAIARRCAFLLKPRPPILPRAVAQEGVTEEGELRRLAAEGLAARLASLGADAAADTETYATRLGFELDVIVRMGFAGYFLIVADFIAWAKGQGIPVGPGRGSGAGSVVAWALTITDLDPIRFNLLFERFLNPERVSMPDFDIDFCQDRRDEVIEYVRRRYGADRVASIITFGKLQARAVLRDVGRVLQMPYGQIDRLCKLVPNNPAKPVTLAQAIAGEPLLQAERLRDEGVARLMDIALKLEGLYRNASTHAAGIVIGDRPLEELVPLARDPDTGALITQYNMKTVEQAGLVKFDFLGLKTLTVLKTAVDLVRADGGPEIDLGRLPLDDAASYRLMTQGETFGVFQLESTGMRDVARKAKPTRFEDVIALVALYRPGPMENIPKWLNVRDGKEPADYLHPILRPILEETFGIMIYQEQVMQAAQRVAGYSLGGADLLRRAMGKKDPAGMAKERAKFVTGAVGNGVDEAQAGLIFDQMERFAGYGFNKSHAAAYALVAYQTAWMKANHPVAFMAASMTFDLANTDKLKGFRDECRRMGIKVAPPDVNRSGARFRAETRPEKLIRYALGAVKGVGIAAMEGVEREVARGGPFRSLEAFARRLDGRLLNKRQLERLAAAGALDALEPNRARAVAAAEPILRLAQAEQEDRETGQGGLFGPSAATTAATPAMQWPSAPPWDPLETLRREHEAVGFYLSAHPLDAYAKALARMEIVPSDRIAARVARGATRFRVAGIVEDRRERAARSGNKYAFVQLSDAAGPFEVTLFSEVLAPARSLLDKKGAVVMTVDAQVEAEGPPRLTAVAIQDLEAEAARVESALCLHVDGRLDAASLRRVLSGAAGAGGGPGRTTIRVIVPVGPGEDAELALPGTWRVPPAARAALKTLPGVLALEEL